MPRSLARLAGPLVALALITACGSSGETSTTAAGTGVTTTAAATTTTARATTTTEAEPATTAVPTTFPATTTTLAPGPLTDALLTAGEVGEGFVATRVPPDDPDDTTPCGTPSVDKVVPSQEQDNVDIEHADGLLLSQSIYRYADAAAAEQAMAAGRAGLACGSGTSTEPDGSTIDFELQEVQLPASIGDEAFAFSGTATTGDQTVSTSFVAIRVGRAITTLGFFSEPGSAGPEAQPILATAATKLATVG